MTAARRLKLAGVVTLMALATLNIWTGSPLLAIWVGSRVQGTSTQPSMTALVVVLLVLAVCVAFLGWSLSRLQVTYDRLAGTAPRGRQRSRWLKSLSGEREPTGADRKPLTVPERVLIASVVLAVMAFEVWFFFFAGSSLPKA